MNGGFGSPGKIWCDVLPLLVLDMRIENESFFSENPIENSALSLNRI